MKSDMDYVGDTTKTFARLPGFKKLIAWQRAEELAHLVHIQTARFKAGDVPLSRQMRSAALSVAANIAEGYGRSALGDYVRFCEIARGSLGELGTYIQHCERVGLLRGEALTSLLAIYAQTSYLLQRLIQSLKSKQRKGTWNREYWPAEPDEEQAP